MARFLNHMVSENVQVFWAELQRGEFITDAAVASVRDVSQAGHPVGDRERRCAAGAWTQPAGSVLGLR